jgi:cleavage and polyadenylation specificity factor subunit 2
MITLTPLAGGAKSSQTTPLCYLLQVDDVRILLDCGSPDWNPESQTTKSEDGDDGEEPWDQYTRSLERWVPVVQFYSSTYPIPV